MKLKIEAARLHWGVVYAVAAVAPLPYGYYTLLRLVVALGEGFLAWQVYQAKRAANAGVMTFGLLALLFNPIVPVHLTREIWFFIDLGAAALFAVHWYRSEPQR